MLGNPSASIPARESGDPGDFLLRVSTVGVSATTSVPCSAMNKVVQVLAALAVSVVVVALWRSPATAASDVGEVIGWVAGLVQEGIGRFADFISEF